jgi:hypothetical protein
LPFLISPARIKLQAPWGLRDCGPRIARRLREALEHFSATPPKVKFGGPIVPIMETPGSALTALAAVMKGHNEVRGLT